MLILGQNFPCRMSPCQIMCSSKESTWSTKLCFFTSKTNTQAFRSHLLFHIPEPSHMNFSISSSSMCEEQEGHSGCLLLPCVLHLTLTVLRTGLTAGRSVRPAMTRAKHPCISSDSCYFANSLKFPPSKGRGQGKRNGKNHIVYACKNKFLTTRSQSGYDSSLLSQKLIHATPGLIS